MQRCMPFDTCFISILLDLLQIFDMKMAGGYNVIRRSRMGQGGMMMKKLTAILIIMALLAALSACSSNQEGVETPTDSMSNADVNASEPDIDAATSSEENTSLQTESSGATIEEGSNILVAYFSWADNAVIEGDVDAVTSPSVTTPGNVAQLATWVQQETGGDLFTIRVTEPYSSDWDECLDRANNERSQNARPELVESVENIADYDVVFLGYPNWWYGAPMAVLSFIEENDLSDKQVFLFCSHGTGGLAGSVEDIEEVLPEGVTLSDNIFDVYEEDAPSAQNDILNWLSELGY